MSDLKPVLRKLHRLAWGSKLSAEEMKDKCFDAWNELMDISESQQPTIADYLEANKEMIDKTGCKVVTIASLKKFGGLGD